MLDATTRRIVRNQVDSAVRRRIRKAHWGEVSIVDSTPPTASGKHGSRGARWCVDSCIHARKEIARIIGVDVDKITSAQYAAARESLDHSLYPGVKTLREKLAL